MNWNIVLVGAGGAWMSNIVGILRDLGFKNLIGVNDTPSQLTERLEQQGIQIFSHGKYQVKPEDAVIYSSATEESPEVLEAKRLKKEEHTPLLIRDYFEFLGEMSKYFRTVGFTGTNGKSSSSAMAITVAKEILPDFGIGIVGALVPDLGGKSYVLGDFCHFEQSKESRIDRRASWLDSSFQPTASIQNEDIKKDLKNIFDFIFTGKKLNYELVKKYIFFVEACEYQRHFLTLDLDYAIITNITLDHTDYFKDFSDYASAFETLVSKVKHQVFTFGNLTDEAILQDPKTTIIEKQHFDFQYIRGDHQQQNASLVFALLNTLTEGKKAEEIRANFAQFRGIRRRMELLTTTEHEAMVFSDYGHVAESLEVGFQALKEKFPDKKLICVFQPHQMHRILQGWKDFPRAMKGYDQRYIYSIYAARENFEQIKSERAEIKDWILDNVGSVKELGEKFANHCGASYVESFEGVKKVIKNADENSIVIVYSAGDIDYDLRKWLH